MLTHQRKANLMARLRQDGRLVATELAQELGVSEDTIRRDLRDLAAEGLLMRVHGGALPLSPSAVPLVAREGLETAEKARLARAAAGMVQDGMVIIMDGGTTHLALAGALRRDLRATVITHSPAIAGAFAVFAAVDLHLIGGRVLQHSMVAVGAVTQRAYAGLRADLCFLGVSGVHPDRGVSTEDADEATIKETMVAAAAETVVLATPAKLNAVSRWTVAPLAAIADLVTTSARPDWLPGAVAHLAA
jgi:DeoR/GlpR family transcriptional regulator of sugar metabolism